MSKRYLIWSILAVAGFSFILWYMKAGEEEERKVGTVRVRTQSPAKYAEPVAKHLRTDTVCENYRRYETAARIEKRYVVSVGAVAEGIIFARAVAQAVKEGKSLGSCPATKGSGRKTAPEIYFAAFDFIDRGVGNGGEFKAGHVKTMYLRGIQPEIAARIALYQKSKNSRNKVGLVQAIQNARARFRVELSELGIDAKLADQLGIRN